MKKNDFKSLLSAVVEYKLDWSRINDVKIDGEVYRISWRTYNEKDNLCLVDTKKKDYAVTEYQLAALRIATGKITAVWLDEFRNDANATNFQAVAIELFEAKKSLEDVRFKVVAQLKIHNNQAGKDIPIYNDRCYEGSNEYIKGVRTLLKDKEVDFWKTPEYRNGMRELRDSLYATPLKEGKGIEANIVYLPVFEYTEN